MAQHAPAGQSLASYRRARGIDTVHLEHVLREIQTDDRDVP
jgi:hypothetical protein